MIRTNFKALKNFLIRNSKDFTMSSTYEDIENFLLEEMKDGRTLDDSQYDNDKDVGRLIVEYRIEIHPNHNRKGYYPVIFTVSAIEETDENGFVDTLEIIF